MPGGRTGRALQAAAVASTAGACFFAPFDQQAPPEADSTRRRVAGAPDTCDAPPAYTRRR